MNAKARQRIPALTDEDGIDGPLDRAFDAAIAHDALRFEQKLAIDTRTQLHRFVCRDCGRKGCWLERIETVRKNGVAHAKSHVRGAVPS